MVGPRPEGAVAIIDEQTGTLIVSPPISKSNPYRVVAPGLGTFVLTLCIQAHC